MELGVEIQSVKKFPMNPTSVVNGFSSKRFWTVVIIIFIPFYKCGSPLPLPIVTFLF